MHPFCGHDKPAILRMINAVGSAMSVIDVAADGVFRFYAINTLQEAALGRTDSEVAGRRPGELFDVRRAEELTAVLRRSVSSNTPVVADHHHDRPEGRRWFRDLVLPIVCEHGMVERVVITSVETTDRRQAVEELVDLESRVVLSSRMETLGQLTVGVLHDLTDLITVIGGYVRLLVRRTSEELSGDREILTASDRAIALIRQLQAFATPEPIRTSEIDINDIIAGVMPLVGRLVGDTMTVLTLLGSPGTVLGDRAQLEQVILNLVLNATEATPEPGTVTIETGEVDGDVMLRISDTGPGMPPDVARRAFEPFFTTKPGGQSPGMGLTAVREIVHRCDGRVILESNPDAGTTVTVYLPRAEIGEHPSSMPNGPIEPTIDRTVLLVEDDHALRGLLASLLGDAGHEVWQAANGHEALRLFGGRVDEIDVLLVDAIMPVMGGVELASTLRAERPELPVILMSGYPRTEVTRDADDMMFLAKPCDEQELLAALS